MKKYILIIFLILLSYQTYATDDWLYNTEELTIDMTIYSNIEVIPENAAYSVNYITANLSFFPRDTNGQQIVSLETNPKAKESDEYLIFQWENPDKLKMGFSLESRIKTKNEFVKVTKEIPFPLKNIPDEIFIYTQPSEIIDSSNKDIIKLASELAKGEDDLYVIVHNLGTWTKDNINYNLSTITSQASQKASWVLDNKQGVCDELTSLFIAMCRSLGIPARFISGISYTNLPQFTEQWGPHGWAEVYFPSYGWIPFDPTYGELGFVDASHVTLKESVDSDESSTHYEWKGRNVGLNTEKLNIDTTVISEKGKISPLINIDTRILKDKIGFGSYNLIIAEVENKKDHYVTTELNPSRTKEIKILGETRKHIVLKPYEKNSYYWIIKIEQDLDINAIYTFPVGVYSLKNLSSLINFTSSNEDPFYSKKYLEEIIAQKLDEESKSYSRDITFDCIVSNDKFYSYESESVICNIKNIGNTFLEDIKVCYKDDCSLIDLGITQETKKEYIISEKEPGVKEIKITARNNQISKASYVSFEVLDKPELSVVYLTYPKNVSYGQEYDITFTIKKASSSNPKNVKVILKQEDILKEWLIDELETERRFIIKMFGEDLSIDHNKFNVVVEFKDDNKEKYTIEKEIDIRLNEVSFFQRIKIFFKNINRWLNSLI